MGKRQESRERIERDIIAIGRRHLVTEGAAGLSVRAIARDLGMVSSAVYRYVASRDDLLTLLLIDAYTELADAVDRAQQSTPGSWGDQVLAIAQAARQWAVDQPACWALLYGSPVPGYHAPAELTVGPGTRVVGALFGAVASGIDAGDVAVGRSEATRGMHAVGGSEATRGMHAVGGSEATRGMHAVPNIQAAQPMSADFDVIRAEFAFTGDDATVLKCFLLWAALVGAISLEVFGQYGADTLTDPAAVFDRQIELLLTTFTG
jgi:AcrR family transcriptional regulator